MRRTSLLIATVTSVSFLTQTAGAYAAEDPVPSPSAASQPTAATVLGDITDALADQATHQPAVSSPTIVDAELPTTGSQPAQATTEVGTLTMAVPGTGHDLAPGLASTALFDGTSTETSVAVQNTNEGLRALVHIDSSAAPERFDFPIGGDVTQLVLNDDGSVTALNSGGEIIATAPAPWATDANGVVVPTHYEVNGTTLSQVVEHHSGNYAYGIVADPWWNPFSWNWDKIGSYIAKGAKMAAKVAMCASAIGLAVYPGAKAYKTIKEFGGIKKAAELFVGAGKVSDVKKLLPSVAEEILGIAAVKEYCF